MKKTFTILSFAISLFSFGQTQITNSDFELWENIGATNEEPTSWNSNKTGTGLASSGPQTCFKDATAHSGTSCARVETKYYVIAVVNGNTGDYYPEAIAKIHQDFVSNIFSLFVVRLNSLLPFFFYK